jgi:hypothetical protein
LLIFLHHGRIANNVGKKDSSELAVLVFHVSVKREQESLTEFN